MRLTHIDSLRLPFGRLCSAELTVRAPDCGPLASPLPVSFDQGRHVGEGDRTGSWMAVSFRLPAPVARGRLGRAWQAVVQAHGTLRTVFEPGDEGLRLRRVEVTGLRWVEHEVAPGEQMQQAVRRVLDGTCRPFARPSVRLCVVETADGPHLVIGSDHAHVDLWSMLVLVRDLLAALEPAGSGVPAEAPDFTDHTLELLGREPAPEQVRRRWAQILDAGGGVMPRFPLPLGEPEPQPERVEVRDVLDVDGLAAFSSVAAEQAVSPLALTVSVMTAVTRRLAGTGLRTVFPVHSRYDRRWHDAVGWFITNSVLESEDDNPAACARAVKEAVQLGSWPLAPLMEPYGGMPEAPGMFAVSWLDLRRLPVSVDAAGLGAEYVSAAIRTAGVMLWFVLDESGAHLRCRYPDTPQARQNVGRWLDELVAGMRAMADPGVTAA